MTDEVREIVAAIRAVLVARGVISCDEEAGSQHILGLTTQAGTPVTVAIGVTP